MGTTYWATVSPTYLEHWDSRLLNLSIVTLHWPLTEQQVEAVLRACYQEDYDQHVLGELEVLLDERLRQFPSGAFVRLGSRSPKDAWGWAGVEQRIETGRQAIKALCNSERVSEDLQLARNNGHSPHLVLREWIDLAEWQEFRCFVKRRKLQGISQYFYRESYPEVVEHIGSIVWAIQQFFPTVLTLLPVDDVVVDVFVQRRQRGNAQQRRVRLLEINPWSLFTDPCLFNWSKDSFDGDLVVRCLDSRGEVTDWA